MPRCSAHARKQRLVNSGPLSTRILSRSCQQPELSTSHFASRGRSLRPFGPNYAENRGKPGKTGTDGDFSDCLRSPALPRHPNRDSKPSLQFFDKLAQRFRPSCKLLGRRPPFAQEPLFPSPELAPIKLDRTSTRPNRTPLRIQSCMTRAEAFAAEKGGKPGQTEISRIL